MKSLVYSFEDVSFRFISTLTGVSDFNGTGLGTITVKPLVNPTELLGSADGQTMTRPQAGSKAEILVSTPQVSTLCKALWNNYTLLSKANVIARNTNQIMLRHSTSGLIALYTMVSYKLPPDLVYTAEGKYQEFTFLAESSNVLCL